MSEADGFADSLRQQAKWIREALTQHDGFDLGDVDTDELDDAAEEIDKLQRELTDALAREGEMRRACIKAVLSPPASLYPNDGTTEKQRADAALKMGAVRAAGYFHERALLIAMEWHVAAIKAALASPAPSEKSHGSYVAADMSASRCQAWRPMENAPRDGTPILIIYWWREYLSDDPTAGRWGTPKQFQFATDPDDEQCFHSIPRATCVRADDFAKSRWTDIPLMPEPPLDALTSLARYSVQSQAADEQKD